MIGGRLIRFGGWLLVVVALTGLGWSLSSHPVALQTHSHGPVTQAGDVAVEGMRDVADIPMTTAPTPQGGVAALTITLVHPALDPIAISPVYPGHPIKLGARGPVVVLIQRALDIKASGIFGFKTYVAVKQYQQAHGLRADGIVGPNTWKSLFGV